ncbi:Promethin Transmembrane protein 159 [Channa argus]|uniref:Promethin Transmembrane protein 159 n=1 Tax=Channa argus TaxID=215402 RepID=A0A6G1QCC7_CHAAH|nr:Promethin Transmembrane protein 159 [Channa argus]
MKMQRSSISSSSIKRETDFQQLWARWTPLLNRLHDIPKVTEVMNSRVGRYLSSHPFLALAAVLFGTMAAVPVGLFLTFALVTIIMSAVGFVFCEVFLLFVAGLTLLTLLSGLALFSILVSLIVNGFYLIIFNVLKYYPLAKPSKFQEESDSPTSEPKDLQ